MVGDPEKTGVGFGLLAAFSIRKSRCAEYGAHCAARLAGRLQGISRRASAWRFGLVVDGWKRHGGRILVVNHKHGSLAALLGERGTIE